MTLIEYRKTLGITYAHIGRLCGVSGANIHGIAKGIHKPSFEVALKIEAATHGLVSRENWYPSNPYVTITIGSLSI
jgi:DNA-binding transcriptional regulator YdaS (Cro superfamily)